MNNVWFLKMKKAQIGIVIVILLVIISVILIIVANKPTSTTGEVILEKEVTLTKEDILFIGEGWLNGKTLCISKNNKVDFLTLKFQLSDKIDNFICDVYDNGVRRTYDKRMFISETYGELNTIRVTVNENHRFEVCCKGDLTKTNELCLPEIYINSIC